MARRRRAAIDRRRYVVGDAGHRSLRRPGLLRSARRSGQRPAPHRRHERRPLRLDRRRHDVVPAPGVRHVGRGGRGKPGRRERRGPGRVRRRRLAIHRQRRHLHRGLLARRTGRLHPARGRHRPHRRDRCVRLGHGRAVRHEQQPDRVPLAPGRPARAVDGADRSAGGGHRPVLVRLVPRRRAGQRRPDLLRRPQRVPRHTFRRGWTSPRSRRATRSTPISTPSPSSRETPTSSTSATTAVCSRARTAGPPGYIATTAW